MRTAQGPSERASVVVSVGSVGDPGWSLLFCFWCCSVIALESRPTQYGFILVVQSSSMDRFSEHVNN